MDSALTVVVPCSSVRLSVCLSQARLPPKRLDGSSWLLASLAFGKDAFFYSTVFVLLGISRNKGRPISLYRTLSPINEKREARQAIL